MLTEDELKKLLLHRCFGKEGFSRYDMERPLIVTEYDGAYGKAGTIVCLEGSPPRGTVVVLGTRPDSAAVYYLDAGASRYLGRRQAAIVHSFLSEYAAVREQISYEVVI